MSSLQRWVKGKGYLFASEPPGIAVEFTYAEFPSSGTLRGIEGQIFCDDFKTMYVGIPVKVNADSGGKPNGIPERR